MVSLVGLIMCSICCCDIGGTVGTEVLGTAVGAVVGCVMSDGDGSDVDDINCVRCHGPCGTVEGVTLG